ncbi:hypothetical protein DFJ73DRAFT_59228 [Zopfochytrium polystomum]|nr:hypothetical protein DFJ73DRAFT_59228 [Zopfochytrium polystomum]
MISLRGATVTHVADILDTIVFNIRDCLAASLSTTGTLFAKTSDGTSRPRPVSLQPSFLFMSDEVRAAAHLCLKSLLSHGAASLPTSLLTAKTTSTKATRLNRLRKRSVRCEAATLAPGQGEFAVAPGVHGGVSALMDAVFDALHRVHEAGIGDANPGDVLCGEEEESGSAECVLADIVGAMVANLPPMLHANLVREVVERIRDLCNSATDSENASGREASRITALIRILSDLASPSSRSRAIREERTQSNAAHVGLPVVDAAGAVGLELNSILETIVEVTMTFTNPLDRSVSNAVLTAAMELVRALSRSAQYREQVNDILVHLIKSTRQPNPQLGGSSDQTSDEKHQSVDGDCIEVLLSFSTASLQVRAALVARRMVQSTWSTKSAILSCLSSSEEADSPSASLDLAPLPCEYLISLSTALLGHERAEVRTRAAQVVTSILLQEASERPRHLENPYGSVDLHRDTSLGRISHSTHSLSSRPVSTAGVLGQGATQSTVMDESCDARDSLHHHLHRMLSSAQCTPDDVVSGLAVSIACTLCGGPLEIEEHVMFWLTVEESLGIDSPESHQIRASLKFALRSYVVWAGAYFEQPALLRLGRGSIPSPSQATEESDFPNFLSHSTLSSHLFMRPIMPLQQSFWPVVWPDVVPLAAFPFISRDEVTAAIAAPSMALPATVPFGKNSPGPIGRSGSEGEGLFGRAAKTSRKGVVESGAATSLKPKLRPLSLPSSNSFGHVLEGGKPVGLLHSRAKGLSPQATRTARAAPSSANVRTRTASATTANVAELLKAITVGSGGGRGRAGTAGPFGGEREASTAASAAAAAAAGVEPGVFRLRFGGEPTLYHHREFSGRPPWAEEPLAVRAAGGRES